MQILFWFLLASMLMAALSALVYPIRKQPIATVMALVLTTGLAAFAYLNAGGYVAWHDYEQQLQREAQAKALLKQMHGPDELIARFKLKLAEDTHNAKGWYLLGKLQAAQGQWAEASSAFDRAQRLEPRNEDYQVHYAHALWQQENQQFTPAIHALFVQLLDQNPKQPDALAMLAMEAYLQHDYPGAVAYWQRLLILAPKNSPEAKAIRQAIAKASAHVSLK